MRNPFAKLKTFENEPGLTFDEWIDEGYAVLRGEKASGRNDEGKATFTRDQVVFNDDYEEDEMQCPTRDFP